jgi:hypothetical protein
LLLEDDDKESVPASPLITVDNNMEPASTFQKNIILSELVKQSTYDVRIPERCILDYLCLHHLREEGLMISRRQKAKGFHAEQK